MNKEDLDYDVYCGIDVGKSSHHIVTLGPLSEDKLMNHSFAQAEVEIRKVFEECKEYGRPLITIDEYGNIGKFLVAVAQDMDIDIAYLPSKTFKKIAETYGEEKSDCRDAYIIADTSRSAPRVINLIEERSEIIEEIKVLDSRRSDIVKETTASYNRLHDLLLQVSPPLEQLFAGEKLHTDLVLRILKRYGGPCGLRRSTEAQVSKWTRSLKYHKTRGPKMTKSIFASLSQMTVRLPATEIIEEQIKRISTRILELEEEKKEIDKMIECRAELLPEVTILRSIPGIGAVYGPAIIAAIGTIDRFATSGNLASYGGIAPKKEQSGTSVKRSKKMKGGNRRLKNALLRSALIACNQDALSKKYYDQKRAEGKNHKQAIRALARRRVEVIYALLKTGSLYERLPHAA